MDRSVSPTHGDQEGSAWNGHFDCTCYHPLFVFNQFGMLERCALRHGNVHSADNWRDVLDPVIARYAGRKLGGRFLRADAAYASPAIYARIEEAGYFYAIRLPANAVQREKIAHRLTRPVGRPSLTKVKRFYEDLEYQAASWDKTRRVIAKIEWHPGELFPKVGFIVTNLPMEPDWVVRFYNQRGTAEQHLLAHASIRCQAMHQGRQIRLPLDAAVLQAVLRQWGAVASARAGLQPGHFPALHRTARGDGRLVADQPATQADQDRGSRRSPRPRHHLPACRGRRHRPDGARHPCRNSPLTSAAVMRVTAIPTQTERKRLGRSVRRAEKRRCRTRMLRVRGSILSAPRVCATADAARDEKQLFSGQNQAILPSNGRPLGECRFKWAFLHWGLFAWGCYALTGLALAYFSYRRGLPLTIRSGLTPLFGKSLSGPLGHVIDIVAVIATVLGVAVTIGFGVSQFASGVFNITGATWLMQADGTPTNGAMIGALVVVMGCSTLSALSGVGNGIKWLSNINMGLTFFFLAFLLVLGSTAFAL